jgi:hypothetical protein
MSKMADIYEKIRENLHNAQYLIEVAREFIDKAIVLAMEANYGIIDEYIDMQKKATLLYKDVKFYSEYVV